MVEKVSGGSKERGGIEAIPDLNPFEELFEANGKNFLKAGTAWLKQWLPYLPMSLTNEEVEELAQEAVTTYDRSVLRSDCFYALQPFMVRAWEEGRLVLWTRGQEDSQKGKANVVSEKLKEIVESEEIPEDNEISQLPQIPLFISETDKHDIVFEIKARAENKGRIPNVLVIDDKVSNLMRFAKEWISGFSDDPHISPTELRNLEELILSGRRLGEFSLLEAEWYRFLEKNKDKLQSIQLVWIPPDKDISDEGIGRILKLIEQSNLILSNLILSNLILSEGDGEHELFPDNLEFGKECPLVICDIDGPLVSQRNVLATREEMLGKKIRKKLEEFLREVKPDASESILKEYLDWLKEPDNDRFSRAFVSSNRWIITRSSEGDRVKVRIQNRLYSADRGVRVITYTPDILSKLEELLDEEE